MEPHDEIAYRVTTERLTLRCFELGDAPALWRALAGDEAHLAPFIALPAAPTLADALTMIRRWRARFDGDVEYVYALLAEPDGELLGCVSLAPDGERATYELGVWLRRAATAQGLATEALAALTELALARPRTRALELRCVADHPRTPRLAARLGFARRRLLDDGRLAFTRERGDLPRADVTVAATAYDALGRRIGDAPAAARDDGWARIVGALAARFAVRARGDDAVVLATQHRFGDGAQAAQDVEVVRGEAFDQPWIVVRAFVGAETALSLHEALAHNGTLAYGALTLEDEVLVLRHALPLAADAAGLARAVHEIGRETARLRGTIARAVAAAENPFAAYLID